MSRHASSARWSAGLAAAGVVTLCVAAPRAVVSTFVSPSGITIPAVGTATPYPSDITVSGLTGTVNVLRITISGFTHTFPADLAFVLVAPGGQSLMLMSGAGGGFSISNVSLTFSDTVVVQPPQISQLVSGTYRPVAYERNISFPAPGPGLVYDLPGSSVTNIANTFRGIAPNGVWRLFALDTQTGDSGSIAQWSVTIGTNSGANFASFDFDGDHITDWAVARADGGQLTWYTLGGGGTFTAIPWGQPGDVTLAGDFDADGKADAAVWRSSGGATFYVRRSTDAGMIAQQWGQAGDDPTVTADYDGDGKTDFAVYRPGASPGEASVWYVSQSSNGGFLAQPWGLPGDLVAPGDYDGDGRADFAVRRDVGSGLAVFYLLQSTVGVRIAQWGLISDTFVPGDYDADGKTDLAVARAVSGSKVFYVQASSTGAFLTQQLGVPTDVAVPADYNGDLRTDFAVWRPLATGSAFFVSGSGTSGPVMIWGKTGDILLAGR